MTKQSKKITIISVLILIITSVLGYLTYNPIFKEAPEVIYRDTYFVNTNSDCKGDRTMYCIPKDRRYEAVKLEDNWKHPLSPIVSIVMNENKDPNGTFNNTNVLVVYLKRDSIFDQSFEVDKYRYNAIGKIGYEKTIELIKKQDIYKNNPDPENIRNVPPLTPQEIENNRKLREGDAAIDRVKKEFNTDTQQGLYTLCLDDEQELKNIIEAAKRGDKTFQAKRILVELSSDKISSFEKDLKAQQEFCQAIRDGKVK
jgi:hypothetical protein